MVRLIISRAKRANGATTALRPVLRLPRFAELATHQGCRASASFVHVRQLENPAGERTSSAAAALAPG